MNSNFDKNLHRRFLVTILLEIFKQFSGKIAFKGGTCAVLFYNLNRFSFDLDFDVLEELTVDEINRLKSFLQKEGTLKDFYEKLHTIFFLFNYKEHFPNIKIEFNRRIWKNNQYRDIWFMGVRMKIADERTVITNKLVAITDRSSPVPRDLFDAHYFLQMKFPINEDLIIERTGKTKKEYLEFLINFILAHYTPQNILSGLGQMLDEQQKRWAKEFLIPETIKLIKSEL